jgi:hypothetical protein
MIPRAAPLPRKQFLPPVSLRTIRGLYRFSIRLEAPTVEWGPGGRYWAYFHDFEPQAVDRILADCRNADHDRHGLFRGIR